MGEGDGVSRHLMLYLLSTCIMSFMLLMLCLEIPLNPGSFVERTELRLLITTVRSVKETTRVIDPLGRISMIET